MTNAKIGAALVGGYLLGRTKKAKAAVGLGMFLAGRKLDLNPRQLARSLADSPALSGLGDQARRELLDATKSAATSALTQRAEHLADSLSERTRRLDGADAPDRRDDADDADREETDELADDDREPEEADEPDEDRERQQSTQRKKPVKRPPSRRRAPAAKSVSKPAKSTPKKAGKSSRAAGKARSGGRGGDDG